MIRTMPDYNKPRKCMACGGTGKASNGRDCVPCKGKGVPQPDTSPKRYEDKK